MKNLNNLAVCAALALTAFPSFSHAGTIEDRRTGQRIVFTILPDHTLSIDGTYAGLPITTILPVTLENALQTRAAQMGTNKDALMALSADWYNTMALGVFYDSAGQVEPGDVIGAYLIPFFTPVTLGANILDVVALPFRAVSRLLKEHHIRKTLRVIHTVISTDETITISDNNFQRVVNFLK